MSFAILYGSTPTIEKSILDRLRYVTVEARHPMLLPGIFTEFEFGRHKRVVDSSIDDLETMIFDLDRRTEDKTNHNREAAESRNQAKRAASLDMMYLRNSIITWKVQVERMSEHTNELVRENLIHETYRNSLNASCTMKEVSKKIQTRLTTICDDYDDKIRDCTMRVDGMAMATQWVCFHGRTGL